MPEPSACRLCGRSFATHRTGSHFCEPCRDKVSKEFAMAYRAECKECGKEFQAHNRVVRYCSDPCRKKGYRSNRGGTKTGRPPGGTGKCRICGGALPSGGSPGTPTAYCSDGCRAEGRRTRMREYMREYFADPEKRAIRAVRNTERGARRRAEAARDREASVQCKECGAEFTTSNLRARYCSDPCRKRGYARRPEDPMIEIRANATIVCRACGGEFKRGRGPGRRRVYCSDECSSEGRRTWFREYARRRVADPRKRAALTARRREIDARRRAKAARDREASVECKECGAEFTTSNRLVKYCSDPCRKRGYAYRPRASRHPRA